MEIKIFEKDRRLTMEIFSKLVSLWLVTQLFFYGPNGPNINIGAIDNTRIDRLIFACIIVWFLVSVILRRISFPKLSAIEWLMFIFLAISFGSMFISGANNDITDGKNKWLNAVVNITFFPFTTYFILKSFDYSRERAKFLITALCVIATYLTLTAFFEHFQLVKLIWPKDIINPEKGTHFGRSRGPFLDAVAMGRVLIVGFSCFTFMVVRTTGVKKWVFSLLAVMNVAAIYFTQTRGPWLGFGIVLLVLAFSNTTLRKFAVVLILSIITVAFVGATKKFSFSNGTLFSERQNTVVDREISYMTTIKMIVDHPVLGIGFGMFNKEWNHYYHGSKWEDFGGFDGSHNTFLTMICELGGAGFFIYFVMFYLLVSKCYTTYKKLDDNDMFEKNLCIITIGLALMYVVTGTVSDLRWSLMPNTLLYLFFGLVGSINTQLVQQEIAHDEYSAFSKHELVSDN
jgi:O-antigen ligase